MRIKIYIHAEKEAPSDSITDGASFSAKRNAAFPVRPAFLALQVNHRF